MSNVKDRAQILIGALEGSGHAEDSCIRQGHPEYGEASISDRAIPIITDALAGAHSDGVLEGLRRGAQAVCDCCGGRRLNADAFEPAEYITTAALWQHRHRSSTRTLIKCEASEIHRLIAAHPTDTEGEPGQ